MIEEENAEVFAKHFFNNPDPVPCNSKSLSLVPQQEEFTFLGMMMMENDKPPGPMGVTSDALCAMVWCKSYPNQEGLNIHTEYVCQ
eukprot:1578886-Ditylum_brightwellii.AAC.1